MRLLFAEDQPQLRRSAREYALLEYLIRNKGIILSREQIENNLWNYDYAGGTNVVDVYISYLRKKLDGGHEKKLLHITRLEQGTQKLQLETADLRREDRWAVLSVRDDGSGIAPEDRERIFQRFYQVDAARGQDGSDLGLLMVQQAARLHGGSVTVDSRIGEGSTFIVRLPLAE